MLALTGDLGANMWHYNTVRCRSGSIGEQKVYNQVHSFLWEYNTGSCVLSIGCGFNTAQMDFLFEYE